MHARGVMFNLALKDLVFTEKIEGNHCHRCNVNLTAIDFAIWATLVRSVVLTWPRDSAIYAVWWTRHPIEEDWQVEILVRDVMLTWPRFVYC